MFELYKNAAATVPSASTDRVRLFVDTDGLPYVKDQSGTVTALKGATGAAGPTGATGPAGAVSAVTGTSPVVSSGGASPAISLDTAYGDTLNPYASKTANNFLAAPNGAAGAPTFRALVAADVPTLDQNTTGTASNVTGIVAVVNGGSGTSTPALVAGTNVTITGSWPNQTINSTASGGGGGTVTSVATGSGLTGGPITSTGTIDLATAYGDTVNPYASKTANFILAAPDGTAGVPTFRAVAAADIPTLNQNTTGTAANVTGIVAVANGGSAASTAQGAMNTFAGAVTAGSYLRGNGANVVMAAIQAGDVPTLNQNTTGTASNVTGTVAVANGGTGLTSLGTGVTTFLGTPSSANLAAAVTDETGSGALVFATTPALTNPTVTDYIETLFSANTGTAITISLTNGTVQNLTLTGTATITMPTAVAGKSFLLMLRSGAGSYSVTWTTVKWPGGTAPTITSTASRMDIYSFFSDGTNWYGTTVGQNYTP